MKTAIFTLMLGDKSRYKVCLDSIEKYAQRYKIPFILGSEQKIFFVNHYFEKLQCLELLKEYDRILCLDADMLITPHARNIFEEFPDSNYLYAFNENAPSEHMNRDTWIDTFSPDFEWPIYNGRKMYFNSACVLYSKIHAGLMDLIKQTPFTNYSFSIDGGEQTTLNYVVAKYKIPFKSITHSFNRMDLGEYDPNNERYKADFIHYAGPCKYGNGNKTETMRQDALTLYP